MIEKRNDISKEQGEKEYGHVQFADPENNKYPIDTEEHIRAAWNYIHIPRDYEKYSSEDIKTIKNRIIKAWKEKINKAGPPGASK